MKSRISLIAAAIATIFSSCSKEANFTNSGTSFGGYHKTETSATAQNSTATEESTITASTEAQPVIAEKTISFSVPKATQTEVANESAEKAIAAAAASMSKKEIKAIAKEIKKEAKKTKDAKEEGKSQVIALVLMLVWPLSIHRFYLGYTGIAIAQILTLGGCGIWALIDLVRIITGDLKPKNGEYAKTL